MTKSRTKQRPGNTIPIPSTRQTLTSAPFSNKPQSSGWRNDFSSKALFGLLIASLCTPLVFSSTSFFGFVSERGLLFRGMVELMLLTSLFKPGFWRDNWSWLQLAVIVFLGIIGVADLLGVDAQLSLFSGFMRMEGFVGYLHLGLYGLIVSRAGFSARQWDWVFRTTVAIAVLVFFVGYASPTGWIGGKYRFVATVGQPTFLAIYWLIHLFLAFYIIVKLSWLPRQWRYIGSSLAIGILLYGLVLTGARSAILGLLAGGTAMGLLWIWQRYRSVAGIAGILICCLGVVLGGYWLARYTTILKGFPGAERIVDIVGGNNTLPARQITNQMALLSIGEKPLLGWGQENYSYAFPKYYDPRLVAGDATEWYDRIHCTPLEWAFSTGLLGLIGYAFIWFGLIKSTVRLPGIGSSIFVGLLIAYLTFSLLNPDNLLASQFFFLLIGFVSASQHHPTLIRFNFIKQPITPFVIYSILVIVVIGLGYLTINGYQTLRQLDRQGTMNNGFERMNFLRKIYDQSLIGRYEVADVIVNFAISVLQEPSAPPEAKQFCYEQALAIMEDQRLARPQYGRLLLRLSSLHLAAGQYERSANSIQQSLAIDGAKRPATFMLLGEAYTFQKKYNNAVEAYKQAYQIQPSWQLPLIMQAQVAALQHDTLTVNKLIGQIDTRALIENLPTIKQVYQLAGSPQSLVHRIAAVPDGERFMFNRPIYQEWTMTAFEIGDMSQVETALRDFDRHYRDFHTVYTTNEINQLITSAHQGIRPDRLNEISARLPVNDGVPVW